MLKSLLGTDIGRLRLMGLIEGLSLIILVLVGVPLKYIGGDASWVKTIGPIHGVLFLLYILLALNTGAARGWSFTGFTWKVLASSLIPFGNFWIDRKLKGMGV